jgi:hypothetical protein
MEEIFPLEGETVMWCGHEEPPHHFFANTLADDPLEVPTFTELTNERSGLTLRVRWVVLCDRCIEKHKHPLDAMLVPMEWHGEGPIQIQNNWKN